MSKAIDKQLGGNLVVAGKKGGVQLGKGIADGLKASEADVKRAFDAHAKLADKAADATGKLKVAQAGYNDLVAKGVTSGQRYERAKAAQEKATRDEARAIREATAALRQYEDTAKSAASSGGKAGAGFLAGLRGSVPGAGVVGKAFMGAFAGAVSAVAFKNLAESGARAYVDTFKSIVDTGLDFSRTMNNFQGVTRASAGELQNMKDAARALGADTTLAGVSASDAAKAMTELAKAGFSVDQAIGAARGTMQLATAGQIDAAQAAEIQANAMNAFGLSAESAAHTADLLANAAIASSADIPDLALALQQAGGIAHGFGESLDDTVAALALFANAGIKGNDAGTLLKTTMQSITDQGGPAQGAIEALGLELYKLDGAGDKVFVGFRELFRQLDVAKKSMSSERFQAFANILFGSDAMRAAMLGNADAFDVMLDKMQRTGAASEMAAAQMKGLPGAVESFKNSTESLKLTAFEQLGPTVTTMIDQITASVQSHGPEIVKFFMDVTDKAVLAAEFFTVYTGVWLDGIGQIIGGIGNTYGAITKMHAAAERLNPFGDKKYAEQLDKEAEAAFGWGENIQKLGQLAMRTDLSKFRDELRKSGNAAATSAAQIAALNSTASKTPKVFGPPLPGGAGHGVFGPPMPVGPASSAATSDFGASKAAPTVAPPDEQSLRAWVEQNFGIKSTFGTGSWENASHDYDKGWHHMGQNLVPGGAKSGYGFDFSGSREQMDALANWIATNMVGQTLELIYQSPGFDPKNLIKNAQKGTGAYGADLLAQHASHVHWATTVAPNAPAGSLAALGNAVSTGGQRVPDWDAIAMKESSGDWSIDHGDASSTGGLQIQQPTWEEFGGKEFAPKPYMATKEQQIAVAERILAKQGPQAWAGGKNFVWKTTGGGTPSGSGFAPAMVPITGSSGLDLSRLANPAGPLVNAFGPGYEPGIGTPGFNEYGDPGYWRTDPKAIRAAERAQADSQQAIADADDRILEAKKRRADLEESLTTTAEDRLKADKEIATAERAAARTREDARDAQDALAEAQKGRFTEAKKEAKSKSSKGSGFSLSSSLSGIGSAVGEFAGGQLGSALDVFGVGDSPGWLKGISTFLGGISIGGGDSSGLTPIAAMPDIGGALAGGTVHGGGYGAQPGPTFNTTIQARDAEGALEQWRRQQALIVASKLGGF